MIASLVLAAALTSGAAPMPPLLRMENVRVIAVGPRPPESGIFAAYADMDVALPGGPPLRMYMLWMSRHQYLPDAGAVCTIVYRREALLPGNAANSCAATPAACGAAIDVPQKAA